MSQKSQIIFQEVPRDYRTEIPNIVFEMLAASLISPSDFILYSVYRRIAGQSGACWIGTRGLKEKTDLSTPTISKSKKNLSRPFSILNGKSLIEITPCDRKKEIADIITIVDIWPENHHFFKNKLTCVKIRHTRVQNNDTPVCKNTTQKKEPYKKEPSKKIIITPDDPPPEIEVPPKIPIPAGGNNKSSTKEDLATFPPCLDICTDLSPLQKRQLLKYSPATLAKAVEYTYHTSTKLKGPQARIKQLHAFCQNPEAYEDSYRRLNEPDRGKSIKEKILSSFKDGEKYNGYKFFTDLMGLGFSHPNGVHIYFVEWKQPNFAEKWLELLTKLKIKT